MILQMRVPLLMVLVLWWLIKTATPSQDVKPGCQEKCGNVSVPYPFGIGKPDCALNEHFFLNCNTSGNGTDAILLGFENGMPANDISVLEGTVTVSIDAAHDCKDNSGNDTDLFEQSITLGSGPFMFSDSKNIFTAIGCDTIAMVMNAEQSYGTVCLSLCTENVNMSDMSDKNPCSGSGCCQTSIPKGLRSLNISVSGTGTNKKVPFNSCAYAFLADKTSIHLSDWQLALTSVSGKHTSDVVVEWVVKNETCEQAKANTSAYACGRNTDCIYSENGPGYRCMCSKGFAGNPYLEEGCQDIDECKDLVRYQCKGKCKNTIGDYRCLCPLGMHGDGKTGCTGFGIITIISVAGASCFLVIICFLLYVICTKRRRDKNFRENGGMVLKHQRVRIFREAELEKATDYYLDDQKLGEGGFGSVYKGILTDNTVVAVKKFKGVDKDQMKEKFQNEIGIVSQVNHRNVVKLLGLCLETKLPLLVYEFISNGTLYKHIHDKKSKILASWSERLRIATEIALALDYLHSLADPPVIHGDIKSVNILLDGNFTAKVADFGASVLISSGQTITVTKIQGTFGYLDPEYLMTGNLTTESDVFSFGVVILELLTGEKPNSNTKSEEKRNIIQYFISALENNHLSNILDFPVADEVEMKEIHVVAELANRCANSIGINRPTMKEVSHELAKLKASHDNSRAQKISSETKHKLKKSSSSFPRSESPRVSQSQSTRTVTSFHTENYTDSI